MLVALWDVSNQFNDNNGSILTNGKIYVYYSGRAALAPTWSSADGSHVNPNPIILDNNGRAVAFADDKYTYTCVVCDFYGREMFSFDPASYGTGGGGSSGEGGPAQHWIGKSGATVSVPKLTATTLPLPENPDYEGDFASVIDNTFVLAPGLYMVDCLVDFRQSSSDLTNKMGSIKFYTSESSDPIEGQIFERNETGPDASGDSHQVQVSFVRHVAEVDDDDALRFEMTSSNDLTYAKIDRLSIVKLEQGGGGTAYAAGYGIQIDGQVISTSGMMPEASAANFVDNSTYQVDIQNIYETIAETSAMIPSGVATEQWVTDYTSAFITSADLPDLSDYATQQWVEDQHYITSADIPDIPEDVITSGELATVSGDIVAQIPSLDGYATEQWVNEQGFITSADLPQSVPLVAGEGISIVDTSASTIISIDSAYSPGVSEEWVEEYVSDATSGFITSADIPDVPEDLVTSAELASTSAALESMIPSLDGYATQQWVEDQNFITSADIPPIPQDVVTSGELATVSGEIVNQIPDVSDMATQTWVGQQGYLTSVPAEYATSGDLVTLSGAIEAEIPNYTAGDNISIVNDEISVSGTAGLIAGENISITASGDNYVISSTGGGGSGSDVDIIPSLQTGTKIADYVIDGTSGELYAPAGGGSVTFPLEVSGSTNVYEATDGLTSGYANAGEIYVGSNESEDPEVEEIYSVRLVPGLVRVQSDVDGDSVLTNIRPNGITINDGGNLGLVNLNAIRNWNDTFDAVADSATYWNSAYNAINASASYWNDAAGMNEYPISAGPGMSIEDVSGVTVFSTDETVLWTGNNVQPSSTAIVVSEALSNFNSVKFYWTSGNGMSEPVDEVQVDGSSADIHFVHCTGGTNMWLQTLRLGISGTSITLQWAKNLNFGNGTSTTWSNPTITTTVGDSFSLTKIVGINRISGGN